MSDATTIQTKDFIIKAPAIAADNKALQAVHALYFLPENYKLVFEDAVGADQTIYQQVMSLIQRDSLGQRVQFASGADVSGAVSISGDSPEAMASAALHATRTAS